MKREVSFFKDRRINSAENLVKALRALGYTDDEIRAHFLKLKAAQDQAKADAAKQDQPKGH